MLHKFAAMACFTVAFIIYWFGMRYDLSEYDEFQASVYSVDRYNLSRKVYKGARLNEYTLVFNSTHPTNPPVRFKNENTLLKSKYYSDNLTDMSGNYVQIANVQLTNMADYNSLDENIDKIFTVYCKKGLPLNSHNCQLPMASNNGLFMVALIFVVSLIIGGMILLTL